MMYTLGAGVSVRLNGEEETLPGYHPRARAPGLPLSLKGEQTDPTPCLPFHAGVYLFEPKPRTNPLFLKLSLRYCIRGKGRAQKRKAQDHRLTRNQTEKKQELRPYGLKSRVGALIIASEKQPGVTAKTFELP